MLKWGILEEKTRDFRLNGGFAKRNACFLLKWGIFEEKMRDFLVTWGICKEKTRNIRLNGGCSKRKRDFRLNVVFLKRKRVIFRFNGVFAKTRDFWVKWGILE